MVPYRKDLLSNELIEPIRRFLHVEPQVRHEHAQPVSSVGASRRPHHVQLDGQSRVAEVVRQLARDVAAVRALAVPQPLLELLASGRSSDAGPADAAGNGADADDGAAAVQPARSFQGHDHLVPAGAVRRQSRVQVRVRLHEQRLWPAVSGVARRHPRAGRRQLRRLF